MTINTRHLRYFVPPAIVSRFEGQRWGIKIAGRNRKRQRMEEYCRPFYFLCVVIFYLIFEF